jgi:hypothetical protein
MWNHVLARGKDFFEVACAHDRGHRGQARERSLPCGRHEHQLVQDQESLYTQMTARHELSSVGQAGASALPSCDFPREASVEPASHLSRRSLVHVVEDPDVAGDTCHREERPACRYAEFRLNHV